MIVCTYGGHSTREHTIPATFRARAGDPHLKSDCECTTAIATRTSDGLVVPIAMFPKVTEVLARYAMHAHLLGVVA